MGQVPNAMCSTRFAAVLHVSVDSPAPLHRAECSSGLGQLRGQVAYRHHGPKGAEQAQQPTPCSVCAAVSAGCEQPPSAPPELRRSAARSVLVCSTARYYNEHIIHEKLCISRSTSGSDRI